MKLSRTRSVVLVVGVVAVVVVVNLVAHGASGTAAVLVVPGAAVVLVLGARMAGLDWREMGLSRSELRAGIPYAVGAVVAVFAIVSVAVAIPATRQFFLSDRFDSASAAAFAALVTIPLQTVLPEELIFRGVLQGSLARLFGVRWTLTLGAIAFGLWHVTSSLGLTAGNEGLSGVLGSGTVGQIAGVLGAVAATTAAGFVFGWLRHRTTSLLAPVALHWALNATGAVGAAVAWHLPS
ncbi:MULTISPECIES: CPBP family intramembrane glutamic endopeptidase [Gordonia]|uniref:CPBP family intramembrane metalloprotease n=1 Tax=Gordonia tangerina TaxID=2911060 RepID=A0ABS9DK39_9ACTN|nr:CPBP family intramembrane glutamic endopeptidase [Gordonia tangerina]MCF3939448.1 CPBP family intramembrane metalloprotease [Gordonia tangerina]